MKIIKDDKEILKQALLLLSEECENSQEMDVSDSLKDKVMQDYKTVVSARKKTIVYKLMIGVACILAIIACGITIKRISRDVEPEPFYPTDSYVVDFELEMKNLKDTKLPEESKCPDSDILGLKLISSDIVNNVYKYIYEYNQEIELTYYQFSADDLSRILNRYSMYELLQRGDRQFILYRNEKCSVVYSDNKYGYVVACNEADDSTLEFMVDLLLSVQ